MKAYIFLFLSFIVSGLCKAQVDSSYIEKFSQKAAVRVFVAKDFLYLNQSLESDIEKTYMPNNPPKIGLGLSLYNTIINFSYGYGFDFMRNKELGKTKAFDFQLHNYWQRFVLDLFIQEYKGFYLDDDSQDIKPLCPDLKIRQYGVSGQYIFNNKRFSYRAAFNQNEKQLKSAGSFLIGFGVNTSKIEADSSFVFKGQNIFRNFQFSLSAGYAHTWVLKKGWFISGSVTTGISFGSEKFSTFGKQKLEVYPNIFPRLAVGYNKQDWSLGFSYLNNIVFPSVSDKNSLVLSSGSFQMTFIKRLNLSPFMDKKLDRLRR